MFTALLDTCVLWPSLQRDFLLSLATESLYRPIWSSAILAELEYHEEKKLLTTGLPEADARSRARFLVSEMRRGFDDAEVEGWEGLDGSYGLPDPDDEHVVAAAVVGGAAAIVTANFADFPAERLPSALQVLAASDFALATVSLDPRTALRAVARISARTGQKGPKRSVEEILGFLVERYALGGAVDLLRQAGDA